MHITGNEFQAFGPSSGNAQEPNAVLSGSTSVCQHSVLILIIKYCVPFAIVFQAEKKDMDYALKRNDERKAAAAAELSGDDAIVRLRGLPFGCTKEEVANFFLGKDLLNVVLIFLNAVERTMTFTRRIRHFVCKCYKSSCPLIW